MSQYLLKNVPVKPSNSATPTHYKCRVQEGGGDTDVTFRTTDNPNDPLGLKLPKQGGNLMPHRFCAPDGSDTGACFLSAVCYRQWWIFFLAFTVTRNDLRLPQMSVRGDTPVFTEAGFCLDDHSNPPLHCFPSDDLGHNSSAGTLSLHAAGELLPDEQVYKANASYPTYLVGSTSEMQTALQELSGRGLIEYKVPGKPTLVRRPMFII